MTRLTGMENKQKSMIDHYHVLSGIHGYMPDNNDFCATKQEARDNLKEWIRIFRDQGVTFIGSLKNGYFDSINNNFYVEITKCLQKECIEEIEN